MKIAISYPPLKGIKGIPAIGQNRQYQILSSPWTAYPMVPAYAASLLKREGYEVFWDDGITEGLSYEDWKNRIVQEKPDLIAIETKTPVIKHQWKIIDELKKESLKIENCKLKIVLMGDHVTALPEESMRNSQVDYILTGGDFDFLLLNLCNHLVQGQPLEPGIWYREKSKIKNQKSKTQTKNQKYSSTGHFVLNHDLNSLPFIDRDLTRWQLYAFKNSNYCRVPGTYTMFGRDCHWGRCSFCAWTILFPGKHYRVMSPQRALDEVGHIINNYPVREIMDDSGSFPIGDIGNWLREFCQGMIERGYNKRVRINCNMRFNTGLTKEDYQLMGKAGFRFLLYGLESANQKTLDRINKNLKVEQIESVLRWAKEAGLCPHPTVMVGFPWETKEDAQRTLDFAKKMFKKGLADSLQATIVIPYPGTPLFKEAKEKGWLKTLDWDRYDMREPILKTEMSDEEILGLVRSLYSSIFSPQFVFRKIKEGISDVDMFRYYVRLGFKFFSKLLDFSKRK